MPYTVEHPLTGDPVSVYVEVNETPLTTTGWHNRNPMVMRQGPARRGTDRIIPGTPGVRAKRRRAAPTPRTLELIIYGHQDGDGNQHADYQEGLDDNIMHLRGRFDPNGGIGSPATSCTLHLPGGGTATGQVHIEAFEIGPDTGIGMVTATLEVTILLGALA